MIKHTIAFDINGNDNGSRAAIDAAFEFASKNKDIKINLIGDFTEDFQQKTPSNIEFFLNKNVPSNPKNFKKTLRESTSMNQAIDMVNSGVAQSILSSGDSGSYVATLTLKCKRITGISRPFFMPVANATNGEKFVFFDVGANLEVKSEWLVEWAKLGVIFAKVMFKKNNPKVTLLNIGTEDYKGLEETKEAHKTLLGNKNINYLGFNETRDLFRGYFDVGVIDGYGGNLVLKSYEGAIFTFVDALKSQIKTSLKYKFGGLLLKGAFKNIMKQLDYRNVGSAWVMGINALALKCHGSSDKKSYLAALNQLKEAMNLDLLTKLQKANND